MLYRHTHVISYNLDFVDCDYSWTRVPSDLRHDHPRMSTLTRIRHMRKWTSYVKAFKSYRITACECMYWVRRDHLPSRDKDGGHTIRSAILGNPMQHANLMALFVIEPELWSTKFYIAGIGIFYLFAPVTLTLTRWPSYTDLTRTSGRYIRCANMNFLRQGFRKLLCDRYACTQTSYEWSLPVWSCDKDGGHTIRSAVV